MENGFINIDFLKTDDGDTSINFKTNIEGREALIKALYLFIDILENENPTYEKTIGGEALN